MKKHIIENILLSFTLLVLSAQGNESIVSTSPNGKSQIVASKNAGSDDISLYYRHRRNVSLVPIPDVSDIDSDDEIDATWSADGYAVWITASAGKNNQEWFFVLRMDGKSGICFLEKPFLPDLERTILRNTMESAIGFRSDKPNEPKFAQQLPRFTNYGIGPDDHTNEPLPKGQFVIQYAELEWNESSTNGSTSENGHVYHLLFETKDWLRFKLLKIGRTGPITEEGTDPGVPVILYSRKSK